MYSQIAANKRRSIVLIVGFIIFVAAFGYVLSRALGNSGLFPIILVAALIYAAISYFASSSVALALAGAKPIQKSDAPDLYRIVENLAITAGLPMPKVYIVNDSSPNAFATGRDPQHAVVAVTSGILPLLDKDELEGVIAHELSHVGNYDIRLMGIVVVLVSVVAVLADFFLRFAFWGGEEEEDRNNPFVWVALVGAILAPLAAALTQLAISRRREYLADASGALLTRYPQGLASALAKISRGPGSTRPVSSATALLYITNPLKGRGRGLAGMVTGLFDTHPPIEERIARLNQMEGHV